MRCGFILKLIIEVWNNSSNLCIVISEQVWILSGSEEDQNKQSKIEQNRTERKADKPVFARFGSQSYIRGVSRERP